MNWRRIICWFMDHKWQVFEGKRHCACCGYEPNDEGVNFCPKCGHERLRCCIMASEGYQYVECMKCDHMFQDTSDCAVTVSFGGDGYELDKPMVDQDGTPIEEEEEQ